MHFIDVNFNGDFVFFQVGSNGIISFGTNAYNSFRNGAIPGTSGLYFVAPFWDDIDTRNGGVISYEAFLSGSFLDVVNNFINRHRPTKLDFRGTWMMVAYYNKVYPYTRNNEVHTCVRNSNYFQLYTAVLFPSQNTFQVILISDGTYSYTIFTYKCGLMDWDNGATIGFNAGDDPYANADPSSKEIACVNSPDSDWNNVIYVISNSNPEDPPPGKNDNSFSPWFLSTKNLSH